MHAAAFAHANPHAVAHRISGIDDDLFAGPQPARDERSATATQIIRRLQPKLAQVQGIALFLQPAQDINVGGRTIDMGQQSVTVRGVGYRFRDTPLE